MLAERKKCLLDCDIKSVDYLSMEGAECYARCFYVYDGDSVSVIVPFHGSKKLFKIRCRLSGINTAELRTKNPAEKKAGYKARDFLRAKILDSIIWVEFGKSDKYGRSLVTLYGDKGKSLNYNELMMREGLAFPYDGSGPKIWCAPEESPRK